jgi:hypothetical protein
MKERISNQHILFRRSLIPLLKKSHIQMRCEDFNSHITFVDGFPQCDKHKTTDYEFQKI